MESGNRNTPITFNQAHSIPHSLYRFHRGNDERPFLADTDIVCKGGYIPVHSLVLMAAGSPVLKEHIISQSRAQRDHMVIHLPDYHISDVTHVVTCFYTGVCTFPRNQTNTIFEIFEQLGVGRSSMTYGTATSDDIRRRSYIRRYLDCDDEDDDDDLFIEDGEMISIGDIPPAALQDNALYASEEINVPEEPPAVVSAVVPAVEPAVDPAVEPAVEPAIEPDVEPDVEPTASSPPSDPEATTFSFAYDRKPRDKKKKRKVVVLPKPQPPEVKPRGAKVTRDGTKGIKSGDKAAETDESDNDDQSSTHSAEKLPENNDEDDEVEENRSNEKDKRSKNKVDERMNESSSDEEVPKKQTTASKRKASRRSRKGSKKRKLAGPKASHENSDDDEASTYKTSDDEDLDDDDEDNESDAHDSESFIVDDASSEDQEFVPKSTRTLRTRRSSSRGKNAVTRRRVSPVRRNLRNLPTRNSKIKVDVKEASGRQLRNRVLRKRERKDESEEEEAEASEPSEVAEPSEASEEAEVSEDSEEEDASDHAAEAEASDHSDEEEASDQMETAEVDHGKRKTDDKNSICSSRNNKKRINKKAEDPGESDASEEQELDEASNYRREGSKSPSSNSSGDDDSDEQEDIDPTERCYLRSLVIRITKLPEEEFQKHCDRIKQKMPVEGNLSLSVEAVVPESTKSNSAIAGTSANVQNKSKSKTLASQPSSDGPVQTSSLNPVVDESRESTNIINSVQVDNEHEPNENEPNENEANSFSVSPQQVEQAIKACPQLTNVPNNLTAVEAAAIAKNSKKWRDKTLNCPICEKDFSNSIGALRCIRSHKKTRCWICLNICDSASYIEHCKEIHSSGNLKDGQTNCPICQQVVPWNSVQNHIEKTHFENIEQESIVHHSSSEETERIDGGASSNHGGDANEVESEDDTSRPLFTIKPGYMLFDSDHEEGPSTPPAAPMDEVPSASKRRGRRNKNTADSRLSEDRRIAEAIGRERPKRRTRNKSGASITPASGNVPIRNETTVDPISQLRVRQRNVEDSNQGEPSIQNIVLQSTKTGEGTGMTIHPEQITNNTRTFNRATERTATSSTGQRTGPTVRSGTSSLGQRTSSTERFASDSSGSRNIPTVASVNVPSNPSFTAETPTPVFNPPASVPIDNGTHTVINKTVGTTSTLLSSASVAVASRNASVLSNPAATNSLLPAGILNPERAPLNEVVGVADNIASQIINQLRMNNQSTAVSSYTLQTNNTTVMNTPSTVIQSTPHANILNENHNSAIGNAAPVPLRTRFVSNAAPAPNGTVLLSSRNAVGMHPVSLPFQSAVSLQHAIVPSYPAMQPPSTIERTNSQLTYGNSGSSDSEKASTMSPSLIPSAVPMMLSSRDVPSTAPVEARSSRFCGTTLIGGVPFKIYSRPGTADPTPNAVVTVSENRAFSNGCVVQQPQSVVQPSITYPNTPNLNQTVRASVQHFQSALQTQEAQVDQELCSSSTGGSLAVDQRSVMTEPVPMEVDETIQCERCEEQFRCKDSFDHHLCMCADD